MGGDLSLTGYSGVEGKRRKTLGPGCQCALKRRMGAKRIGQELGRRNACDFGSVLHGIEDHLGEIELDSWHDGKAHLACLLDAGCRF